MKIRIKGNSIRMRLSKSEVDLFLTRGYLEESTNFAKASFRYAVRGIDAGTMGADFVNNSIVVEIPNALLHKWAHSDLVDISCTVPLGKGQELSLLVEKDFKCMSLAPFDDQSDYFENPAKSC